MELVLVFAVALAFYWITLAPTVIWGDSAGLSLAAHTGTVHWSFSAGSHPLFAVVGRLFALLPGEVARSVNLAAAVFGALTISLIYRCARKLDLSRTAAAVGAGALCVSHAFWQHSVIAEVYTANAFFLALTLNCIIEWRRDRDWRWLTGALAAFTVGLTNHLVLVTMAPAALLFVMFTKRRLLVTRSFVVGLAVASSVLALLVIRPPTALAAAVRQVWHGPPAIAAYLDPRIELGATLREVGYYVLYLVYQFPAFSVALGAAGIWALWRRERAVAALLLGMMAVNAAVFVRHTAWPSPSTKYVFYIADYVVFALFCAVGADIVLRRVAVSRRAIAGSLLLGATVLAPPAFYARVPILVEWAGVDLLNARTVPYRDNRRFFLNPNKRNEDGARRFGEHALEVVKPSAVIFADYTPYQVLRYLQTVEGRRPDVVVHTSALTDEKVHVRWVENPAGRRIPIYTVSIRSGYYDLAGVTGPYRLVPVGPLLEVLPQ